MATLATLLKEALFDEKRIVTYMYLSRRGNVSCVEAIKTMRELYNERKDGDQLNAVYSLIGHLKANGSRARRVMLVREDKLETTKSTFEKVISCDIYSLQTSVVRNLNILYGIDKADEEEYADQDAANSMVRCTQLAEEGRRARSVTPLLWSSSDEESIVAAVVKVEKQASETKAKTTVRPPVAKQSSLSAAFAKNKPLPPLEKPTVSKDEEPPAAKAKPVRSEKRPTASPDKKEAPKAKKAKVKNEANKKRRIRIDSESDGDDDEETADGLHEESTAKTATSASQDSTKDMFSSGSIKDMFSTSSSPNDIFSSSSPERDRSESPPAKRPLRRSPRKSVAKNSIESDDDDFVPTPPKKAVPTPPKKVVVQQHLAETFKDAQGFLVTKEVTKAVVVENTVENTVETRTKAAEPEKALRQVQEAPKKRSGKQAAVPSQTKISSFFGKK